MLTPVYCSLSLQILGGYGLFLRAEPALDMFDLLGKLLEVFGQSDAFAVIKGNKVNANWYWFTTLRLRRIWQFYGEADDHCPASLTRVSVFISASTEGEQSTLGEASTEEADIWQLVNGYEMSDNSSISVLLNKLENSVSDG